MPPAPTKEQPSPDEAGPGANGETTEGRPGKNAGAIIRAWMVMIAVLLAAVMGASACGGDDEDEKAKASAAAQSARQKEAFEALETATSSAEVSGDLDRLARALRRDPADKGAARGLRTTGQQAATLARQSTVRFTPAQPWRQPLVIANRGFAQTAIDLIAVTSDPTTTIAERRLRRARRALARSLERLGIALRKIETALEGVAGADGLVARARRRLRRRERVILASFTAIDRRLDTARAEAQAEEAAPVPAAPEPAPAPAAPVPAAPEPAPAPQGPCPEGRPIVDISPDEPGFQPGCAG